jgi:hypothetical protein
LIFLKSK